LRRPKSEYHRRDVYAFVTYSFRPSSSALDLIKTPAKDLVNAIAPNRRSSILASPGNLETSPSAVVDYLDRNTRKLSTYVADGIEKTHLSEYSDLARSYLSSPLAVNGLAATFEFASLFLSIVEWRKAFGLPIPYFGKVIPVTSPDLFALITPDYWAPITLWLLTTVIAPTLVGYFFNYPLRTSTSHSYATRRATAAQDAAPQVDLVVFNIAKALISYLVFAASGPLGVGPYSKTTIQTVNTALPFGYSSLVTTSLIAATISLYEAVLKK
jgi:hypothetical protein